MFRKHKQLLTEASRVGIELERLAGVEREELFTCVEDALLHHWPTVFCGRQDAQRDSPDQVSATHSEASLPEGWKQPNLTRWSHYPCPQGDPSQGICPGGYEYHPPSL